MAWLGITSFLYVNPDAYGSPDFTAVDLVADAQLGDTWDEGSADARESRVHQFEPTMLALDYAGNVRFDPTDAGYQALRDAHVFLGSLDVLILNGASDKNGAEGYRFFSKVFGFGEDQAMGNVIYKAFTIKPCPGPQLPVFVKVAGGVPTYHTIGEEGS